MGDGTDRARQVIKVGDREVELPRGVSVVAWSIERSRRQNPRLRIILEALRELEQVLDSHYFILHCSSEQLTRIRGRVAAVFERLGSRLAPLLGEESCVPALETARRDTRTAWLALEESVGRDVDGGERKRRTIATAAGRLHAFLREALGRLLEADPRSVHQADYFLSQRFSRDFVEAEALHSAVSEVQSRLSALDASGPKHLAELADRLGSDGFVSTAVQWKPTMEFLDHLVRDLLPSLQAVLVMPGVRYSETKALDRLCRSLSVKSLVFLEVQATYRRIATAPLPGVLEMKGRLKHLLEELSDLHGSLTAFVPAWLSDLGKRRALMLLPPDGGTDATGDPPA